MKPATKTALAYVHITGYFPKGIHMETFMAVFAMVEDVPRNVKIDGEIIAIKDKKVKDEYLHEIADHPFVVGDKVMKERGFIRRGYQKRNSRTIEYSGPELEEGYITREGKGCWIWSRNERGGMNTERFDVI